MKKRKPRSKFKHISPHQWADAIKVLMGTIPKSTLLSKEDNRKLQRNARAMTQEQAVKIIDALGWRIKE